MNTKKAASGDDLAASERDCDGNSRAETTKHAKVSYSQLGIRCDATKLREYFAHMLTDYPGVLDSFEMSALTGLSRCAIFRHIRCGSLKALRIGCKLLIPQPFVLDYVASDRFIKAWSNSKEFHRILGEYEKWANAQS
jgi:predicted DNA-binding transcriptional regulator AlpA